MNQSKKLKLLFGALLVMSLVSFAFLISQGSSDSLDTSVSIPALSTKSDFAIYKVFVILVETILL